ncbi:MAG: tRNA (adenosine(37)-N6)-dimethylallyltransferase MiaA [candidate division SR1 bacterium CG_4_9_14_3_um_filter_40_9]|nr:MAG: tRNA (adenosine(37)-N6)-dimethylallyltransferase MiaA [candidate division SR1 bacterium CG_4_9_14_3_um_filter_40_9]
MEIENIVSQVKEDITDFHTHHPNGIIIIRGATVTGKSKLSILLSEFFDVEIISADSRQIFKYMDIGTDKVPLKIRKRIPHHQIDTIDPDERYTAGQRQHDTKRIIKEIQKRKKLPMIVGGTGLYIDTIYKNFTMPDAEPNLALREQLYKQEESDPGSLHRELMKVDPEEAIKIHPKSTRYLVRALEIYKTTGEKKSDTFLQQEVDQPILMIGLRRNKEETNRRINIRIKEMLKGGLIDEVKGLQEKGYIPDLQSMQGIGYKETIEYLQGKYDIKKLEENLKKATHHLAKKQRTRFRRYIAEGKASPKKNVIYKVFEL